MASDTEAEVRGLVSATEDDDAADFAVVERTDTATYFHLIDTAVMTPDLDDTTSQAATQRHSPDSDSASVTCVAPDPGEIPSRDFVGDDVSRPASRGSDLRDKVLLNIVGPSACLFQDIRHAHFGSFGTLI